MAIVSFDIETSDVFDLKPGEDLEKHAPFHVAVAGVVHSSGEVTTWLSMGTNGAPLKNMTQETASELLKDLRGLQESGHTLCAWNGASFDLKWLAYAARDEKLASQIALDLCDPMLQFFNVTGYPVSLDAVARGLRLQETKIMESENAPKLWCRGDHDRVIDYVCSDARITTVIAERIQQTGSLSWITKRGTTKTEHIGRLRRVREVLKDPEPDQSWMDAPIRREKFTKWILTAGSPTVSSASGLESEKSPFTQCLDVAFRIAVSDVCYFNSVAGSIIGNIESGAIRVGELVEINGLPKITQFAVVMGIQIRDHNVQEAFAGKLVGLLLRCEKTGKPVRGQLSLKRISIEPHAKFWS